jgi:Bacterial Ig-like domain (group 3)
MLKRNSLTIFELSLLLLSAEMLPRVVAAETGGLSSGIGIRAARAETTLAVSFSPNPPTATRPVTLHARVTTHGATDADASGAVSFFDGTTLVGTAVVVGGTAVLSTSALRLGEHVITAEYGGDVDHLAHTKSIGFRVEPLLPAPLAHYDPSRQIRFTNAATAEAARQRLVTWIWPQGLPTNAMPVATVNGDLTTLLSGDLAGVDNALVASVDKLDADVAPHDFHSISYLIHPRRTNANTSRLVVAHQGHQGGLVDGIGDTANRLLQNGFNVLAVQMPLTGWNTDNTVALPNGGVVTISGTSTVAHNNMFARLTPALSDGTVYRFFLEPVVQGINYFLRGTPGATDVSMFGLSGGGWTTHMLAAVDPRIRFSFPVAGSYPLYVRNFDPSSVGDLEQYRSGLYRETDTDGDGVLDFAAGVASWLEIYALGAYGPGRRQTQILNLYDACCFGGHYFTTYADFVSNRVVNLGQGAWNLYSDTSHGREHKISPAAWELVILPALGVGGVIQAEAAVVSPTSLNTPTYATGGVTNAYVNDAAVPEASGTVLAVMGGTPINASNAPCLRFANLTPGATYRVLAAVANSPQNKSIPFRWAYGYTAAPGAVGDTLSFSESDLLYGPVNPLYPGQELIYQLAPATADEAGTISLHLGGLAARAGTFPGIDYFVLVPAYPPAHGWIPVLRRRPDQRRP